MNTQSVNYANIQFPVEVPSTANELLLLRGLADEAETLEEKIGYLDQYMVTLYTNHWRATMY
jgi:oligoendopeptidase F